MKKTKKIDKKDRKYYQKNKEKIDKKYKECYQKNKEKIKQRKRERYRQMKSKKQEPIRWVKTIDTIGVSKEELVDGITCPHCTQNVKMYGRNITSSMAYGLVCIYNHDVENNSFEEFIHLEDFFKAIDVPSSIRGDISKLRFWGILEKKIDEGKKDGNPNSGYYKITDKGKQFVKNLISVPKFAHIFNNTLYGFSGEDLTIKDCFKNKFNYNEVVYDSKKLGVDKPIPFQLDL